MTLNVGLDVCPSAWPGSAPGWPGGALAGPEGAAQEVRLEKGQRIQNDPIRQQVVPAIALLVKKALHLGIMIGLSGGLQHGIALTARAADGGEEPRPEPVRLQEILDPSVLMDPPKGVGQRTERGAQPKQPETKMRSCLDWILCGEIKEGLLQAEGGQAAAQACKGEGQLGSPDPPDKTAAEFFS
jgi:hypothetical protein